MRIRVGCGDDVYGTIAIAGDQLDVEPATSADGPILGRLVDHYHESLVLDGVKPDAVTPRVILLAMLDRMNGHTWAKLVEA